MEQTLRPVGYSPDQQIAAAAANQRAPLLTDDEPGMPRRRCVIFVAPVRHDRSNYAMTSLVELPHKSRSN